MSIPVNASIVEHFQTLEDPRIERTKKHHLLDILVIALCTLLTGGEGFQDMELFGKSKRTWLQTFLALPHGIPSHDTFGRVFARLHPQRFQECFLAWTRAVAQLTQGALSSLDGSGDGCVPVTYALCLVFRSWWPGYGPNQNGYEV
jgi:hypothetical protein